MVRQFFEDEAEFEQVLEDAEEKATSSKETIFIDELSIRYADYGMDAFISEGQVNWLRQIADR